MEENPQYKAYKFKDIIGVLVLNLKRRILLIDGEVYDYSRFDPAESGSVEHTCKGRDITKICYNYASVLPEDRTIEDRVATAIKNIKEMTYTWSNHYCYRIFLP